MASLGIGFVCASMPFNAYRGAVSRGILCNRNCDGVQALADDGDEIEMDYSSGRFTNHTRIVQQDYPAIEPGLIAIMTGGGMHGMLRQWRE